MAQRERKKNPCAKCQRPFEAHFHAADCALPVDGWCNCPVGDHVDANGPEPKKDGDCPNGLGGSFVESRIFRASPSSAESYKGCPRKWASRALGGIKQETEAQRFGTRLHEIAEKFLLTRETPDQTSKEGRLFNEGIPFLPKRKLLPEEIEGEVSFTFDGVPWIGYYDWKLFDEREIGDHKTSSDPKKWGLTSADLPNNLQACTYSYDSGWPETNLKWLYYGKRSNVAYPVLATVGRQQATDVIGKYSAITKEMQKLFDLNPNQLTVRELNEIPNDPNTCDFTGRNCDFADHCQLMRPTQASVKKETNSMDPKIAELKARIAAKKAGEAAGTSPATNPPEVTEALKETEKEVLSVAPSAPPEPPPVEPNKPVAPVTVEEKIEAGKPKGPKRPPPAAPTAKPNSFESIVEHFAALADNLPKGVRITIEITPQSEA